MISYDKDTSYKVCLKCSAPAPFEITRQVLHPTVKGSVLNVEAEISVCKSCGHRMLTEEQLAKYLRRLGLYS